jgi:hypothetical protein
MTGRRSLARLQGTVARGERTAVGRPTNSSPTSSSSAHKPEQTACADTPRIGGGATRATTAVRAARSARAADRAPGRHAGTRTNGTTSNCVTVRCCQRHDGRITATTPITCSGQRHADQLGLAVTKSACQFPNLAVRTPKTMEAEKVTSNVRASLFNVHGCARPLQRRHRGPPVHERGHRQRPTFRTSSPSSAPPTGSRSRS